MYRSQPTFVCNRISRNVGTQRILMRFLLIDRLSHGKGFNVKFVLKKLMGWSQEIKIISIFYIIYKNKCLYVLSAFLNGWTDVDVIFCEFEWFLG